MKFVGYFEGTDSLLLTKLSSKGIGVLPLGNSFDNHGKYIGFIDKTDNIGVVVGYAHKVMTLPGRSPSPEDLLSVCSIRRIPVVLVSAEEDISSVNNQLSEVKDYITIVPPEKAYDTIMQRLT